MICIPHFAHLHPAPVWHPLIPPGPGPSKPDPDYGYVLIILPVGQITDPHLIYCGSFREGLYDLAFDM